MVETLPAVPPYTIAPRTTTDLDYAELRMIDLSKGTTPEGRIALAQQVKEAMSNEGFFYVINHGYTLELNKRMIDIANVPFEHVGEAEKRVYEGKIKQTGSYQGYKLRQYWHIDSGVHDQIEHYSINRNVYWKEHPEALRPFLPEIEAFAKHNHFNVLHPILRLLALGLELPEETFVDMHGFSAKGESSVRFMKYYPRPQQEEEKTNNVRLKGHTDIGSVTILYSQPVAGLQILTREGQWKWVKHIENALVINAGDAMEFLSGGFYRATIHRVTQPPLDQQDYTRVGAYYFAMTDDDVILKPLVQSPILQHVVISRRCPDEDAPSMEQWRKGRTSAYGKSDLKRQGAIEEEMIKGILVKHYN